MLSRRAAIVNINEMYFRAPRVRHPCPTSPTSVAVSFTTTLAWTLLSSASNFAPQHVNNYCLLLGGQS